MSTVSYIESPAGPKLAYMREAGEPGRAGPFLARRLHVRHDGRQGRSARGDGAK